MLLKDVADILFSFPQKSKETLENNWLWLSSSCLQEDNRILTLQEENNFIPDEGAKGLSWGCDYTTSATPVRQLYF